MLANKLKLGEEINLVVKNKDGIIKSHKVIKVDKEGNKTEQDLEI